MKVTRVDITPRWAGCVNIIRSAPNGAWIEVELLAQGPLGGVRKHCFKLDLFDASDIARKVQECITAQRQHLDRVQSRANGTGF
ncbi:MAG: hypothetical protein ACRDZ4_20960 [Egibacteraceae bacterium]